MRFPAFVLLFTVFFAQQAGAAIEPPPYVTRAETAMILLKSRLGGRIPAVTANGRYPDIRSGSWYERYVVLAARYRIIEPQAGTNRMRPDDVVFRSEFLVMLQRTFGLRDGLPHSYTDVSPQAWYAPAAGIAKYYGLFPHDTDTRRLLPDHLLTHAEMAQALQILLRKIDTGALATLTAHPDPAPAPSAPARQNPETLVIPKTVPAPRISTTSNQVTLVQASAPRLAPAQSSSLSSKAGSDVATLPKLRADVLALINSERAKAGLHALKINNDLQQSAQRYAEQMLTFGFFSHVDPSGKTLRDRMDMSGYQRSFYDQTCFCAARATMGENIAQGQKSPAEVVRDWMASPPHKAAILTAAFTDTGIGIRSGIWVQHFGGVEKSFELSAPSQ